MNNIYLNSKHIQKGDTFVALQGANNHGADFLDIATTNGVSKIISDKNIENVADGVILEVDKNVANNLDALADNYYPNAKNHKIIAITGTNGKTSVASFLSQILDNLGVKNQVIGTLTGDLTTPDIFSLYKKLHNFDGEYTILEVSSHALSQERTKGLEFEIAIWTNLTQDHLDYHHTMEAYGDAKLKICNQAKFGIFNEDDDFYCHFKDKLPHVAFGLGDIQTEVKEFGFLSNIDNIIFETNLIGEFNIYNILATYKALLHFGFDKLEIIKNIANLQNPVGRMQKIKDNNIWVDFAHTPDGLKNALQTIKNHYPEYNLTVVFGCGGNRDTGKRAKMGKIAGEIADRIILTNDNPRDENPMQIIEDIKIGTQKEVQVILDRALAIEAGISGIETEEIAKSRDRGYFKLRKDECVLIAGKGAENYQIIGSEVLPFNDVEIVNSLV